MTLLQDLLCFITVLSVVSTKTSTEAQNTAGYKFGYTVNAQETGDYKTHHEESDGKQVRGSYSVGEPNGDLRVVTYTADRENGFRALVKVHPGGATKAAQLRAQQVTKDFTSQENLSPTSPVITDSFYNKEKESKQTEIEERAKTDDIIKRNKTEIFIEEKEESKPNVHPVMTENMNLKTSEKEIVKQNTEVQEEIKSDVSDQVKKSETTQKDNKGVLNEADENSRKTNIEKLNRTENITNNNENKDIQTNPKEKFKENDDEKIAAIENITRNTKTTKNESVTLFKILPALDKHVPKVEYIVEEVLGADEEESDNDKNSELREGKDEIFDGSQIIPVKIIEDPKDQSPEMVGLKTNSEPETTIMSVDVVSNIDEDKRQGEVQKFASDTPDIAIDSFVMKELTTTKPQDIVDLSPSTSQHGVTNKLTDVTLQELYHLPTQNIFTSNIKGIQDNLKSTSYSQTSSSKVTESSIGQHKIDEIGETVKPEYTVTQSTTQVKESEIPNNIILAALMFPSTPIVKFTCHSDNNEDLKTTSSPSQNSNTGKVTTAQTLSKLSSTMIPTAIPLYPFQLLNFKPSLSQVSSLQPSLRTSQPVYSDFTTIPSTPFVNIRTISKNPLTTPKMQQDSPKPTQETHNVGYSHQKSVQNRHHYPLYPIPPPWTYHPLRPSHNHPRHYPIFVLPMSHNFNFAPTFNPEAYDSHNH